MQFAVQLAVQLAVFASGSAAALAELQLAGDFAGLATDSAAALATDSAAALAEKSLVIVFAEDFRYDFAHLPGIEDKLN